MSTDNTGGNAAPSQGDHDKNTLHPHEKEAII